nr:DUF4214 domain-containing protein [Massilia rhizosphaerae]
MCSWRHCCADSCTISSHFDMEAMMATTIEQTVEQLYIAYFSRPADPKGLAYWENVLTTNPDGVQQISAAFAGSQEYKDTYAGLDNTGVVQAVYHNLFGRAGEQAGVDYWVNLLNNHTITVDNVVTTIASGAQNSDKLVYDGRVAVATSFTAHVDQPAEIAAYSGTAANVQAKAFIGTIVDLQSAAYAIDPGVIDTKIAEIVGSATGTNVPHHLA